MDKKQKKILPILTTVLVFLMFVQLFVSLYWLDIFGVYFPFFENSFLYSSWAFSFYSFYSCFLSIPVAVVTAFIVRKQIKEYEKERIQILFFVLGIVQLLLSIWIFGMFYVMSRI